MIRKAILIIGGAALALPVLIFGGALVNTWWHPRPNIEKLTAAAVRIEMMAPESPEWMEQHFPAADGQDERTKVTFRNGNVGWRFFRANHTLERIIVTRKDGVQLVDLWYSPEGKQIVGGFERRNDGTLRREARTEGDHVELRTYWQDGKTLFSVVHRKIDDFHFEGTFFHPNGVKWAAQVGTTMGAVFRQSLWNENGNPVSEFVKDDLENTGNTTLYAGSGSIRLRQVFTKHAYEYESEHGSGTAYKRALSHVDVYDAGKLAWRIVMDESGDNIARFERYATIGGTNAKVEAVPFAKDGPAPIEMTAELTSADSLTIVRPDAKWAEAEKKVSVTTETK